MTLYSQAISQTVSEARTANRMAIKARRKGSNQVSEYAIDVRDALMSHARWLRRQEPIIRRLIDDKGE